MARTSTTVAGGNTGALPNANPALDRIAGDDYPFVKLADATTDSIAAIGVDANPLKVKPRRRGTADYESGVIDVPDVLTVITTATIYPDAILVTNITDAEQTFTLTNTAGKEHCSQLPVAARETRVIAFPPHPLVGIKVQASAASAVLAIIAGGQ